VTHVAAQTLSRGARPTVSELFADYRGVYNLTSAGAVSWFGFAREIFRYRRTDEVAACPEPLPIAASEYPARAQRPQNSRLDKSKLKSTFGIALPEWNQCLRLAMQDMGYEAQQSMAATC
jgi:dTDP-4-dehydrorhamnose reductase